MSIDHYTYRLTWSQEDSEHIGLCTEFPSLSWLAATQEAALAGIQQMVAEAVADMQASALAMQAAEQGISLNRLASAKLAG